MLTRMNDESAHPPEGEFATWTPQKMHGHLEMLRDYQQSQGNEGAVGVANIALTMLQHMTCPHMADPEVHCFRLVLEHDNSDGTS